MFAAGWPRNLEVVRLLIDQGANVNAKNQEGQTALSHASANYNSEIVQYLKSHESEVI